MASSHDLPQPSGATQPACRIAMDFSTGANPLASFAMSTVSSAEYVDPMSIAAGTDGYLTLFFSDAGGMIYGPLVFAQDERIEQIQHWLEDEERNDWLAHAKLSTSDGQVLEKHHCLNEYPVRDGDILSVTLVAADGPSIFRGARPLPCPEKAAMFVN